jgi:hypothetical protein
VKILTSQGIFAKARMKDETVKPRPSSSIFGKNGENFAENSPCYRQSAQSPAERWKITSRPGRCVDRVLTADRATSTSPFDPSVIVSPSSSQMRTPSAPPLPELPGFLRQYGRDTTHLTLASRAVCGDNHAVMSNNVDDLGGVRRYNSVQCCFETREA